MLKIKAPCSSANVGPGFDCLGIAFDIYNCFTFEKSTKNSYNGFAEKYCNDTNLVYRAYKFATESFGEKVEQLKITFEGEIPAARGLGSSSTCIVAGVVAAYELAGKKYDKNDVAYLASRFEKHPDNVSACVYGGFVNSVMLFDGYEEKLVVEKMPVHQSFDFYALIPNFSLNTRQSREILPKSVSLTAAKKNVANVALLIKAFERGDGKLLSYACEDWLHQPYRGGIIEGFFDIKSGATDIGANAVFLSGAGPTILVVSQMDIMQKLSELPQVKSGRWQIKRMHVDTQGYQIEKI